MSSPPQHQDDGSGLGAAVVRMATVDIAAAAMSLVLIPVLIRRVGVAEYGLYAFLSVLTNQLTPLQLGVGQATTLKAADARGRGDLERARGLLDASILAGLASALAAGLATLWAWRFVAGTGFGLSAPQMIEVTRLSGLVAILMSLQPLLGALQGHLLGCERYRFIAGMRAVQSLLRPVLVLALVAGSGTLASAIVGLIAADVGCLLASWTTSRRGRGAAIGLAAAAREAVGLVRAGVPFATIGIGVGLLVDAERLAVAFLRSARELAYYSIAANGILRLSLLPGVMAGLLIPRVAKLVAAGRHPEAAGFGNRATRLGLGSVLLLAIPLAAVLPELLALWLGSDVALAVHRVALVLLVGLACSVASYSSHATLKALGCTGLLNTILWLELPLYGLLVVAVVGRFGYVGAAFCLLGRLAVEAVVYVVLAERRLPGLNRGLGRVTIALALFAAFCVLLDRLDGAGLNARLTIGAVLWATTAALLLARDELQNLAAAARAALR